jgi:glycosyl hydrolase family 42 (putative beta-galactosidase)
MAMHRPTTRTFAFIAICTSLVLTGALLQRPAAALAQPPSSRAVPAPNGLDVVLDTKALEDKTWLQALHDPSISGVALQIRWSDLEPTKDRFDWSKLDELMSAAQSSKKWVHLLIFPGFFSPDWALQGAQTDQFPIQYGPGKGTIKALAMPWDPVYLNHWLNFVSQVGTRYAKSPALRMVAADGPTSVSAEFTLPNSFKDLKQWQSDGYTPSKYLGAWREVFQAFSDDFPNQVISLSEGACLGINDKGRIDHAEHDSTRQAIVDMGISMLKPRFALQMSDIHAGVGFPGPDPATEDDFVLGYVGQIITGFQMRTAAENDSAVMGAAGNPPLALRKSINKGLQKNAAGQHVNYLEIYEPDVLAAETQPVLRYGASLFSP